MSEQKKIMVDAYLRAELAVTQQKQKNKETLAPLTSALKQAEKDLEDVLELGDSFDYEPSDSDDDRGPPCTVEYDETEIKRAHRQVDRQRLIAEYFNDSPNFPQVGKASAERIAKSISDYLKANPRMDKVTKVTLKRKKTTAEPSTKKKRETK